MELNSLINLGVRLLKLSYNTWIQKMQYIKKKVLRMYKRLGFFERCPPPTCAQPHYIEALHPCIFLIFPSFTMADVSVCLKSSGRFFLLLFYFSFLKRNVETWRNPMRTVQGTLHLATFQMWGRWGWHIGQFIYLIFFFQNYLPKKLFIYFCFQTSKSILTRF